ncbi:MAG TPA: hypothetical protein VKF37_10770 [Chloroflexota bacterium]|nr:hypothetical protein [Chloroflexota bacterium]
MPTICVQDLAKELRPGRGRHATTAILAVVALVLRIAAPVWAAPLTPGPELTLPAALMLMPDTPVTRSTGVWYADYALAERVYGVGDIAGMTDPRISRFVQALVGLRPGPETGVSALTRGRWRQVYGYDLFQITSEIYTDGAGAPRQAFGVDVGRLDTASIAHVLAAAGYTRSAVADDRVLVRAPALSSGLPHAAMNAVALGAHRLVAGVLPADVIATSLRLQNRSGTLGRDPGYRALAAALGPVQGAYLAANVPPWPFKAPPGGHQGARLHRFGRYAVAYQEPRPGRRFMEIALHYARGRDARADASTLRARLRHESLLVYGVPWTRLTSAVSVAARGTVLVLRLRLARSTPPPVWQDAVVEGDLSILSR